MASTTSSPARKKTAKKATRKKTSAKKTTARKRTAKKTAKKATRKRARKTTAKRQYVIDHDRRWRPKGSGPVCGYTFRDEQCSKRGPHYCEPRATRVVTFFARLLFHTKGPKARNRQRFILAWWQEHEIIRPLFGEVVWSDEHDRYVRRYRIAYIVVARKNGKSELAAGILLYLLIGDDEVAAEVYGAAKDTKQAGKVFEPALRMTQLEPQLNGWSKGSNGRLGYNKNARRLFDEQTGSHYEVLTADALGELGHNPHGFNLDEVLSQPDASLWEAMTTAAGAREQELLFATTTETNDPVSFGAELIDEAERVQEDPARAPHIFAFVRKLPKHDDELDRLRRIFPDHPHLPVSTDPFDEANWAWANPALDDFKSRDAMRRQAMDAQSEPSKENAFRQFQVNQRVQQVTRFVPLDLWDAGAGEIIPNPEWMLDRIEGRKCWGGLDLSAKLDMTSWTLLFEDGWVWQRFWIPESVVPFLDEHTGGQFSGWVDDGWVTVTDGDVVDYQQVYDAIEEDAGRFAIVDVTYDKWSGEPVRQEIESRTGLTMVESDTTYQRMTMPMREYMALLKESAKAVREGGDTPLKHGGNPVLRWQADALEAKSPRDDPDRIRPVKPERNKSGKRIDGQVTLFMALDGRLRNDDTTSIYETQGLSVL